MTEPRIQTVIPPKNWARVEDYAVYENAVVEETEPVVEEAPTEPEVTEPVVEETEPPVQVTEPPKVYYNVAKDMKRSFVAGDLGDLIIGDEQFNLLTAGVTDLETIGFTKGNVEKNSGVSYQYFFDGYKYAKDDVILYVDADSNGTVRGIKVVNPGIALFNNTVFVGMGLSDFYDALEAVLDAGESISRMTPADGVKSYTHVASANYRAVFTCTKNGVQEIAIFAEDYVSTWGPISN